MSIAERKKSPFLFLGNDPAVDLVNTTPVLGSGPAELLGSFADVASWLAETGLATKGEAQELRRALGKRCGGRGDGGGSETTARGVATDV